MSRDRLTVKLGENPVMHAADQIVVVLFGIMIVLIWGNCIPATAHEKGPYHYAQDSGA